MIKLLRIELPAQLLTRTTERAQRLRQLLDAGEVPPQNLLDAYRDPELKSVLVQEASGKCIYCESHITHIYFGDIEHMKPKDSFPRERLDVSNLALACAVCNNAKGSFWNHATPLLNPYVDDPKEEVLALGYLIARKPGRQRARLTIERLQLNRQALLERRLERIHLIEPLADQYSEAPPGAIKDLLRDELQRLARASGEYSIVVRAYLQAACNLTFD